MPLSNDNQDYGKSDEKNEQAGNVKRGDEEKLSSDDLKGKKVDADPEKEEDKPAAQQK